MDNLFRLFDPVIRAVVERAHYSMSWISKEELFSESWSAAIKSFQKWQKSGHTRGLKQWIITAVVYTLKDVRRQESLRRIKEVSFGEYFKNPLGESLLSDFDCTEINKSQNDYNE